MMQEFILSPLGQVLIFAIPGLVITTLIFFFFLKGRVHTVWGQIISSIITLLVAYTVSYALAEVLTSWAKHEPVPDAFDISDVLDRQTLYYTYAVKGVWEIPVEGGGVDVCYLTGYKTIRGELSDPSELMSVRNERYRSAKIVEIHDIEVITKTGKPEGKVRLPRHRGRANDME